MTIFTYWVVIRVCIPTFPIIDLKNRTLLQQQHFFAKTFAGLESLLEQEIQELGGRDVQPHTRGVSFTADEESLYRVLFHTRLALRVLLPVASGQVDDQQQLYEFVRSVEWHDYLTLKTSFAFDCVTMHRELNHQVYLSQLSKDALVDQFREKYGVRPDVDPDRPDILINLHVARDGTCNLSLDASGDSLNQRGYRESGGEAPLNEVLAAALIRMSGWDPETPFVDPMCGSGTLLIEAALIAKNKAPALLERSQGYGIQRWPFFRKALWNRIRGEAIEKVRKDVDWIQGCDANPEAVSLARKNINKARLNRNISVSSRPFEKMWIPSGPGTILVNPPYGKRVGEKKQLEQLYPQLPGLLKKKARGYTVCFITADPELRKHMPMKPEKTVAVMNGPLECAFLKYSIH